MASQLGQTPAPPQVRVNAYCSLRYNSLCNTHWGLARAYSVIMDHAHTMRLNNHDPERDLLNWLSKPHTDPDLTKACKEVLEIIGAAP
jgi:hypothetical protein